MYLLRYQVPPGLTRFDPTAHFAGRDCIHIHPGFESFEAVSEMRRRIEIAAARGHQQPELPQHAFDRSGESVVPGDNALGCIASAQERHVHAVLKCRARFPRDIDE